jgi:hypothetical protein
VKLAGLIKLRVHINYNYDEERIDQHLLEKLAAENVLKQAGFVT